MQPVNLSSDLTPGWMYWIMFPWNDHPLHLYLYPFRVNESWSSASAFCVNHGGTLPVLQHREDIQLFHINRSTYTVYLGLKQKVSNAIYTIIMVINRHIKCNITNQTTPTITWRPVVNNANWQCLKLNVSRRWWWWRWWMTFSQLDIYVK